MRATVIRVGVSIVGFASMIAASPGNELPGWPEITKECRPGTYWWWMGSAVDPANLTRELERYRAAGLGGVHVIPIYGAKGYENRHIEYLSPQWLAMLRHAVREAQRLDMFVDMTTGSGWNFGGPNVRPEDACAWVDFKTLSQRPSLCPVKRASPDGAGLMLNPFYGQAMQHYLERFTQAFAGYEGPRPRAMYHDSFEYNSNWSPDLLAEFFQRRGYRLETELPAMQGKDTSDHAARVKSDYRETVSDIMIENCIPRWIQWSHDRGFSTRYQAHGSPANLLDLYALADIPETEMFKRDRSILVSKFASSAGHVAGRKLVAAETGTWLKEHFTETLADVKDLVDQMFLSGVNHVFYHGTCYSPDETPWPGWLFYASTQMNPRNSIWRDVGALNAYVARCQAVLQSDQPDNEILLYWPIYDLWHNPRLISVHHAAGLAEHLTVEDRAWFECQPVGKISCSLWERGYGFDFVSDRQLAAAQVAEQRIVLPGGSYQTVVIPPCEHMPLTTLSRLLWLVESGATVVFVESLPRDVPGAGDLGGRRQQFQQTRGRLKIETSAPGNLQTAALGKGRVLVGPVEGALRDAGVRREPMTDRPGLQLIRRALPEGRYYFLAYRGDQAIDGWIPLGTAAQSVAILDPMTGRMGLAALRTGAEGRPEVYLQLHPGQSVILRTWSDQTVAGSAWEYYRVVSEPVEVGGRWEVKFVQGGPQLPAPLGTRRLVSWTKLGGEAAERFAGTACYTIAFDAPVPSPSAWSIDLGDVRQSARVRLNGEALGVVVAPPFRVPARRLRPTRNVLEIEVTNLSANRIRDLDRRGAGWKNFHDTNFVNMNYQPFNASDWPVRDSGLLGPVRLIRLEPFVP